MDEHWLFLINRNWTHPGLDFVMTVASSWSLWLPVVFGAAVLLVIFGRFRGRAAVACIALAVLLGDGMIIPLIKKKADRPRPERVLADVRMLDLAKAKPRWLALSQPLRERLTEPDGGPVNGRSFPSGHVINNFIVATILATFFRWGWMTFGVAALVSYSRIYVGSHWPSDVLISIPMGIGIGLLAIALLDWVWHFWGPKVLPACTAVHPRLVPSRKTPESA